MWAKILHAVLVLGFCMYQTLAAGRPYIVTYIYIYIFATYVNTHTMSHTHTYDHVHMYVYTYMYKTSTCISFYDIYSASRRKGALVPAVPDPSGLIDPTQEAVQEDSTELGL